VVVVVVVEHHKGMGLGLGQPRMGMGTVEVVYLEYAVSLVRQQRDIHNQG